MIRTRKRGKTYSFIFEAGKTPKGKRRVIEKGGYSDKTSAYNAGVEAYQAYQHGGITSKDGKVLFEDFAEQWLQHVQGEVKTSSYLLYRKYVIERLSPAFGKKYLTEVTPFMLDTWLRQLANDGLARKTLITMRAVLSSIFKYAVYPCKLLQDNPLKNVTVPKQARTKIVKREVVTEQVYSAILEKYPPEHPYNIIVRLLYNTGLRINEILSLQWSNIKEKGDNAVNVVSQTVKTEDKTVKFSTPKTHEGFRTLFLDIITADALQKWKVQQDKYREKKGGNYFVYILQEDGAIRKVSQNLKLSHYSLTATCDFICTYPDGRRVSYESIRRALAEFGTNAHSFRHTHATRLVEAGVPIKAVAGRLGQKTLSLTADLYSHNTEKLQKDALELYEASLKGANTPK